MARTAGHGTWTLGMRTLACVVLAWPFHVWSQVNADGFDAEAADADSSADPSTTAQAPPEAAADASAVSQPAGPFTMPPLAAKATFEAALGLVVDYGPAFNGSSDFSVKPQVGGFIRYGRFTFNGGGGFTTRRKTEVERGLAAELVEGTNWRATVSLRGDSGRKDSVSPQLAGLGHVRPTLRVRFGWRWQIAPGLAVSTGTRLDLLGRVGGAIVDAALVREWMLSPTSRLSVNWGITAGSGRYMQAWHGVTPVQAMASSYPVYGAQAGLRDTSVGTTWRKDLFGADWAVFVSASTGRLLGSAAKSPFTTKATGWGLSSGIVRRF